MTRVKLTIERMTCEHCLGRVKQALTTLPGVHLEDARIGEATLSYDPDVVTQTEVTAAVEKQGYPVAAVAHAA